MGHETDRSSHSERQLRTFVCDGATAARLDEVVSVRALQWPKLDVQLLEGLRVRAAVPIMPEILVEVYSNIRNETALMIT